MWRATRALTAADGEGTRDRLKALTEKLNEFEAIGSDERSARRARRSIALWIVRDGAPRGPKASGSGLGFLLANCNPMDYISAYDREKAA